MSPALEAALANAYDLSQVKQNPLGAVGALKAALANNEPLMQDATVERDRLAQVVAARGDGDHVSRVLSELLAKALA